MDKLKSTMDSINQKLISLLKNILRFSGFMPEEEQHLEQAPILSVQIKDDNTSQTVPIEIKLETMDDLSRRGIRRAYVFLGLGLHLSKPLFRNISSSC